MYISELHMHTSPISPCAHVPAEESVPAYVQAGYRTLVITNHYNQGSQKHYGITDPMKWAEFFLSGYRDACRAAEQFPDISVLLGMEICFVGSCSEFLVYGLTEEDILCEPEMDKWGIERFYPYAHERGWLVIQAHPFRNWMTVTPPHLIDGIEVFNGNPRHDSRNDMAKVWADKFGCLHTVGSDYHQREDLARGGIRTERPITTCAELIAAIRDGAEIYMKG